MNEYISLLEENNACQTYYLDGIMNILNKEISDYSIVVTNDFSTLPATKHKKIVMLVSEEGCVDPYANNTDVVAVFRFYASEWGYDDKRVFPIPIGYNCRSNGFLMQRMYPEKNMADRQYDIFYSGQPFPWRERLVKQLNSLKSSFNVFSQVTPMFRQGLDIDDYYRALGDARICVAPSGASSDTFRYQEACGSGCVVITTSKPALWYYHEAPVFFINDWSELTHKFVSDILRGDTESIRERTLTYYNDFLSEQAVANYILRCLKSQIN